MGEGWLVILAFVIVVGGDRVVKGGGGVAGGGKEGGRLGSRLVFSVITMLDFC